MASLSGREKRILKLRAGIGYPPHTLKEIGELSEYDLSKERIRQSESKAFRKLHCPANLKRLDNLYKREIEQRIA